MDEIIKEVLSSVSDKETGDDEPLPVVKGNKGIKISLKNFHEIPEEKTGSISFVDGGNSEVFGAASFSLQLIRTACVELGGKRKKDEFSLLIKFKDGKFEIKTFPEGKLPKMSFDSFDPRIRTGNERIVAAKVGDVCRRLAELTAASKLETDFVVIDGDLIARNEQEEKIIEEMKVKKNTYAGLAKTSNVMTKKGRVMPAVLSEMKNGSWFYHPVFENQETSFVRLNPASKHVFRLDLLDDKHRGALLATLKKQSNDAVFPGYPYGLIEADRVARISNKENDYIKTKMMTKMGSKWSSVKTYLRTKDAHEILDNIG